MGTIFCQKKVGKNKNEIKPEVGETPAIIHLLYPLEFEEQKIENVTEAKKKDEPNEEENDDCNEDTVKAKRGKVNLA